MVTHEQCADAVMAAQLAIGWAIAQGRIAADEAPWHRGLWYLSVALDAAHAGPERCNPEWAGREVARQYAEWARKAAEAAPLLWTHPWDS